MIRLQVPFSAKAPWKNAQLAVHGKEPTGYDADELKAYLVEITRVSTLGLILTLGPGPNPDPNPCTLGLMLTLALAPWA